MNAYRKIVFSKTLDKVEWNNSVLAREVDPKSIVMMKQQPGRDLLLLGSAKLVWVFMKFRLIDEYRIWVNPIILASGISLFGALDDRQKLKLVESKLFNSGLIGLYYQQAD